MEANYNIIIYSLKKLFNWRMITSQYFFAFAIHQHESATGIHVLPPSWTTLPHPSPPHPSRLSKSIGFGVPASYFIFFRSLHWAPAAKAPSEFKMHWCLGPLGKILMELAWSLRILQAPRWFSCAAKSEDHYSICSLHFLG